MTGGRFNGLNQLTNKPGTVVVGPNAAVIDREHTSFVAYAELANGANVIAVAAMDFQGHSATNPYQINVASNSVAKTLTCDLTGNLTTAAAAGSTQTCAWDAENRLVTMRTLPGGHAQSLEWDPLGRLVKITERSGAATNWVWTAAYNPLNRRLSSTYTPLSINEKPTTINQFYDPQVEFLEIGVSLNGARTWKIHGPDLNGRYGGLIGLGGLEATVRESDNVATGLLNDFFGNGVATIPSWSRHLGTRPSCWIRSRARLHTAAALGLPQPRGSDRLARPANGSLRGSTGAASATTTLMCINVAEDVVQAFVPKPSSTEDTRTGKSSP